MESLASIDDALRTNGVPMLELGTWQNTNADECRNAVQTALEVGYRHINTVQAYGSEVEAGEGIAAADVDRGEVFPATKVWTDELSHDDIVESTEASLEKLDADYVDLLYVHWPSRGYDAEETLMAFDELVERGLTEHAGTPDFESEQVREAVGLPGSGVFTNQIEIRPLFQQEELRGVCAEKGIENITYSPLAHGEVSDVGVLSDIVGRHDANKAQTSLAWLREKGVTAIPKATNEVHIRDNWESLALELDDEDVTAIDTIDIEDRRVDPDLAP